MLQIHDTIQRESIRQDTTFHFVAIGSSVKETQMTQTHKSTSTTAMTKEQVTWHPQIQILIDDRLTLTSQGKQSFNCSTYDINIITHFIVTHATGKSF